MKKILALFFILFSTLDARAFIVLGRSLEWLADTSPSIGIYTVASVDGKPWNHNTLYSLGFKLKDSLKGKPPADLKFKDFYYDTKDLKVAPGDQFLVFLREDEDAPLRPVQVISLAHPGGVRGSPMFAALTAKFEALADGDAILRTVRERMTAHPGTVPAQDGRAAVAVPDPPALRGIDYEFEFDGYALMVPPDLQPEIVVSQDLEMFMRAVKDYYKTNHVFPSGGPAKILKTLCDANLVPADVLKARTNPAGEFLDPWGTPYRIDLSDPREPRIWSCGPDRKDHNGAAGSGNIITY